MNEMINPRSITHAIGIAGWIKCSTDTSPTIRRNRATVNEIIERMANCWIHYIDL